MAQPKTFKEAVHDLDTALTAALSILITLAEGVSGYVNLDDDTVLVFGVADGVPSLWIGSGEEITMLLEAPIRIKTQAACKIPELAQVLRERAASARLETARMEARLLGAVVEADECVRKFIESCR